MSIPTKSPVDMGANKITNLADPSSAQDAVTKAYADALVAGGGGGVWGSIAGTLSSQTDLQAALDAKVAASAIDTDVTLAANSDVKLASQKAAKAYTDRFGFFNPSLGRLCLLSIPANVNTSNFTGIGDTSVAFGTTGGSGAPGIYMGITAIGATASGWAGQLIHSYNVDPYFQTRSGLTGVSNARAWVGLTDQTGATMLAGTNPAGNYAAFMFDSATSGNWKCITKDGTTQTIVDSGVAQVTTVLHRFCIDSDFANSKINFWIDGVRVAQISTHLPTAGTAMRFLIGFVQTSGSGNGVTAGTTYINDRLA